MIFILGRQIKKKGRERERERERERGGGGGGGSEEKGSKRSKIVIKCVYTMASAQKCSNKNHINTTEWK